MKLNLFPVAQLIGLLPSTIIRLWEQFHKQYKNVYLSFVLVIFDCSQGLFFALIYGLNPLVTEKIKELFLQVFCCKNKEKEVSEVSYDHLTSNSEINSTKF